MTTLNETIEALRREIGPPTERDHQWQPMVSAGEIRQLLDAIDTRYAYGDPDCPRCGLPKVPPASQGRSWTRLELCLFIGFFGVVDVALIANILLHY